ncbi:hypothetical protein [Aquipuribacter sp. SD81]|uniref:hypothetical protein n=1 Tax=Aquipuribacter sp. SD81 TaxID=3127703 RepID=UPI003018D48A
MPLTSPLPARPAPATPSARRDRIVGWLQRRRRLSALVPVALVVLGTPHSCPFC